MKIRKILFILLLLLIMPFYQNNKITVLKKEMKMDSNLEKQGVIFDAGKIYKAGENELFTGNSVKFSLSLNNNTFSKESVFESGLGYYKIYEKETKTEFYEKIYNSLSPTQKEFIDSITEESEFEGKKDYYYFCSEFNPMNEVLVEPLGSSFGKDGIINTSSLKEYYCSIYLPTVLTLEETQAPAGYVREKRWIPGVIQVVYKVYGYNAPLGPFGSSAEIGESGVTTNPTGENPSVELYGLIQAGTVGYYSIELGTINKNQLLGIDIDEAADLWEEYHSEDVCYSQYSLGLYGSSNPETIPSSGVSNTTMKVFAYPYNYYDDDFPNFCMTNQKGKIKLEISSYVNNTSTVTTRTNQTLDYKVVVENVGEIKATDNIVRSKLPENFVYEEGSASDDGVYNNGYIEWHIDSLEKGEKKELTYLAYAPNGLEEGHDYIGEATVENFAMDEVVESNKTMVRLSFQNPKTMTPLLIILTVFVIILCSLYIFTSKINRRRLIEKE